MISLHSIKNNEFKIDFFTPKVDNLNNTEKNIH